MEGGDNQAVQRSGLEQLLRRADSGGGCDAEISRDHFFITWTLHMRRLGCGQHMRQLRSRQPSKSWSTCLWQHVIIKTFLHLFLFFWHIYENGFVPRLSSSAVTFALTYQVCVSQNQSTATVTVTADGINVQAAALKMLNHGRWSLLLKKLQIISAAKKKNMQSRTHLGLGSSVTQEAPFRLSLTVVMLNQQNASLAIRD